MLIHSNHIFNLFIFDNYPEEEGTRTAHLINSSSLISLFDNYPEEEGTRTIN
ncbi:hypothetical protein BN1326_150281 [Staphylococcus argenteus]|uniref:Uncharacterized protein n=1 Tax=Staphylococcus argenteus TaxID=985002 RepID=A0A7U7JRV5_9STAP|nr:hypothetical protein BN1326_150281 [Staphylococcus argenteus]CRI19036.1 hypothetical protein BN1326_150281 [Staphylococcus argenteus]